MGNALHYKNVLKKTTEQDQAGISVCGLVTGHPVAGLCQCSTERP